jgi:hypothetical protein
MTQRALELMSKQGHGHTVTITTEPAFAATGVGNRAHREGADRHGARRIDPADERRKPLWGAPRIRGELLKLGFEIAQSSVAKYMVKRRAPPTLGGEPSCVTTRRTLPPWTCALFQLSVSTRFMPSSSSGSAAETSSGSTSQQIRRQIGLLVKSRRHFLGMRLRTTSSAIATGSMAASSRADCAPWASGTSLPHQPRPGRTLALHNAPHELVELRPTAEAMDFARFLR